MSNVIKGNVGSLYALSNGMIKDPMNLSSFHPLSTVNMVMIHLEDGGGENTVTTINYKSESMKIPGSHWFPLFYRGLVEHTVSGESSPRTFAQYITYIPTIVSRYNVNSKIPMNVSLTVIQESGTSFVGSFSTLTELNTYATPEELDIAYVTDDPEQGYYQYVDSAWELMDNGDIVAQISSKQYNLGNITIQGGFASNLPITTLSDEQYKLIWQELESLGGRFYNLEEQVNQLELEVEHQVDVFKKKNLLANENDWSLESYIPDNILISNSRNGWCQVGDELYVFGGAHWLQSGGVFDITIGNKAFKYNLKTRVWTELSLMPAYMNEQRAVHKDGVIYLFGGNMKPTPTSPNTPGHYNMKYTIATDTYEYLSEPADMIARVSGAVLIGSEVYVFVDNLWVGTTDTSINTRPIVYNIDNGTWTWKTATNTRFDRGFAVLYNGLIYVQRSLKFQAYNPTTDTWITNLTPPIYGLVHTGLMQVFKGKIFIGSGWETSQAKNNPFIQYYDVAKNTWYVISRLEHDNEAIGYGTLTLLNEKMIYVGGYSNESNMYANRTVRAFQLEKLLLGKLDELDTTIADLDTQINTRVDGVDDRLDLIEPELVRLEEVKADIVLLDGEVETINEELERLETDKEDKSNKATDFTTINNTLYPSVQAVKNRLDLKVDKILTIIGLDLQDDITLSEFKTALGNATQSLAGLMSASDKTHLDNLVALLATDDGDNVVNTIGEILQIFNNYPEGADLVTALAGKVDKVEGKGLSTNDLTDTLVLHYNQAYAHSQIQDGSNPHNTNFANLANKPTTIAGYGITDVYNKTYIDALKDMNGWENELLTITPLEDNGTIAVATLAEFDTLRLQVVNTNTDYVDTDSFDTSIALVEGYKLKLYDEDVYLEIGATNATFNAPTSDWKLMIVGLKYSDFTADEVATSFTDTNYLDAETDVESSLIKLDEELQRVEDVVDSNTSRIVENEIDIREVKHNVSSVVEDLRKMAESDTVATVGDVEVISMPKNVARGTVKPQIDGITLQSQQLITNGDFSNGTTGWSSFLSRSSLQNVGNNLEITILSNLDISSTIWRTTNQLTTQTAKYYYALNYKPKNNSVLRVLYSNLDRQTSQIGGQFNFNSHIWNNNGITSQVDFLGNFDTTHSVNDVLIMDYFYLFNITTLITNKQYSPLFNTTFDLMSDAQIKTQMDAWVTSGELPNDNIQSVSGDKRLLSVGKNLFDITKFPIIDNTNWKTWLDGSTVYIQHKTTFTANLPAFTITGLKDGVVYSLRNNQSSIPSPLALYKNGVYVTTLPQGTTRNIAYVSGDIWIITHNSSVVETVSFSQLQLEAGSTASAYEAYVSSEMYLQAPKLNRVPNGVKDTIEYRNGKFYHVKRVQEYTLVSGDIVEILTNGDQAVVVRTKQFTDMIAGNFNNEIYVSGYTYQTSYVTENHASNIGKVWVFTGDKGIRVGFVPSTTLGQAQTALAGTKILYQLATPIETEIIASGKLLGFPKGTVYEFSNIVAPQAVIYGSNAQIADVSKPIATMHKIIKLNANGSQTELSVSSGLTIAGGGLSFTHTALTSGDIIIFSYFYADTNAISGRTAITYYNDDLVKISPNGKAWKLTFTVNDSGVPTVSTVEVV